MFTGSPLLLTPSAGEPTDPFFTNVVLLLNLDGSNGSTVITDVKGHPFTALGNAQISTAQSKFGGASCSFDGANDSIRASASNDFALGSGDFTIEGWFRTNSTAGTGNLITYSASTSGNDTAFHLIRSGTQLGFNVFVGATQYGSLASSVVANTWYHFALTRAGTTMRAFKDGVIFQTTTVTGSLNNPANMILELGEWQTLYDYNGFIDEVRITKGVARYTANFVPPSLPFPKS